MDDGRCSMLYPSTMFLCTLTSPDSESWTIHSRSAISTPIRSSLQMETPLRKQLERMSSTVQDQEYEIAPKTDWVVQSGDIVTYWPAKQYSFTSVPISLPSLRSQPLIQYTMFNRFKWIPFVVSLPKSVVGEKKREYSALAKSVGKLFADRGPGLHALTQDATFRN